MNVAAPVVSTAAPLVLHVHVLGTPWVARAGSPVRLPRSVAYTLAVLVMLPEDRRNRSRMAAHLFGDCPERVARRRLSTALWRLRTECRAALGHEVVDASGGHTVGLLPGIALHVDAQDFRRLMTPGLRVSPDAMSPAQAEALETAARTYTGELLESADDEWVLAERSQLANLYLAGVDHLVQYFGLRGDLGKVTIYADRAVAAEPLREDVQRHVMLAYQRTGRPDLATRQFELYRLLLLREMGADPLPETIALHSRIALGEQATAGDDVASLVADLERARRDVRELAALVERALDAVRRLR